MVSQGPKAIPSSTRSQRKHRPSGGYPPPPFAATGRGGRSSSSARHTQQRQSFSSTGPSSSYHQQLPPSPPHPPAGPPTMFHMDAPPPPPPPLPPLIQEEEELTQQHFVSQRIPSKPSMESVEEEGGEGDQPQQAAQRQQLGALNMGSIASLPSFLPAEIVMLFSELMKSNAPLPKDEVMENPIARQGTLFIGDIAGKGKLAEEWEEGEAMSTAEGELQLRLKDNREAIIFSVPLAEVTVLDIIEEGPLVAFEVEIPGRGCVQVRGEDLKDTIDWLELLTTSPVSKTTDEQEAPAETAGEARQADDVDGSNDEDEEEEGETSSIKDEEEGEEATTAAEKSCKKRRVAHLKSLLHKPRIALRKLELYVSWLNSLHLWRIPIKVVTLGKDMANGLLLCSLMEKVVPKTKYVGIHKKPCTHQASIRNLEMGLRVVWKSRKVNNSIIPSAEDLYRGKSTRVADLMAEIFEVYVMKDIRRQAPVILRWYAAALRHYNRDLTPESIVPPFTGLWEQLQDGLSLFCLLFHYCGPDLVVVQHQENEQEKRSSKHDEVARRIDPNRICQKPKSLKQYRANIEECFLIMKASGIEVLWTVDDWIAFPDQDFLLYQLKLIYDRFSAKPCALRFAHGYLGGLVPGPYGKAQVTDLDFADTITTKRAETTVGTNNNNNNSKRRPDEVTLGDGRGQTLMKLPIYGKPDAVAVNNCQIRQNQAVGCKIDGDKHTFSSMLRYRGGQLKTAQALNALEEREKHWNISVKEEEEKEEGPPPPLPVLKPEVSHHTHHTGPLSQTTKQFLPKAIQRLRKEKKIEDDRLAMELQVLEQQFIHLEAQAGKLPKEVYGAFHQEAYRGRELIFQEFVELEKAFQSKLSELEKGDYSKEEVNEAVKPTTSAAVAPAPAPLHHPPTSPHRDEKLQQLEQKWVKSNRAKASHSLCIERLQNISEEHLRNIIRRSRRARRNQKQVIGEGNGDVKAHTAEEAEEDALYGDAWEEFKESLHYQHEDWLRRLNEEEVRVAGLDSFPGAHSPSTIEGLEGGEGDGVDENVISVEEDDDVEQESSGTSALGRSLPLLLMKNAGVQLETIMHVIRAEELYWMAQEEERTRLYLSSAGGGGGGGKGTASREKRASRRSTPAAVVQQQRPAEARRGSKEKTFITPPSWPAVVEGKIPAQYVAVPQEGVHMDPNKQQLG